MADSTYKFNKTSIIIYLLALVGLVIMNLFLVIQNRNLKTESVAQKWVLQKGQSVRPLSGIDINNEKRNLEWSRDNRKTLLFIFSPKCSFCVENMPTVKSLLAKIDSASYRIVFVSTMNEGTKDFVEQYGIQNFQIITEVDPASKIEYEMKLTPQTILIDPNGKVEQVWIGLMQESENKSEIEKSLNISLSESPAT
jgi:peroxiredoxin